MKDSVLRRIARDASSKADFFGDITLVYDRRGQRVGCFPGGRVAVEQWSGWEPGYLAVDAGNGRRFTAEDIAWLVEQDELRARWLTDMYG